MGRSYEIVFVGGVHGVGKTTFSRGLAERIGADQVSASELIRDARNCDELTTKRVANVERNQDLLVEGLNKASFRRKLVLLDGHFCLMESNGNYADVPLATFCAVAPAGVILLEADAVTIHERMTSRGGTVLAPYDIAEFQRRETERALWVSQQLGIELLRLGDPFDHEVALEFVGRLGH